MSAPSSFAALARAMHHRRHREALALIDDLLARMPSASLQRQRAACAEAIALEEAASVRPPELVRVDASLFSFDQQRDCNAPAAELRTLGFAPLLDASSPAFSRRGLAPILIRFYGDSMQALVPSYLEFTLDRLTSEQQKFRDQFTNVLGSGPLAEPTRQMFQAMDEQTRKNMTVFRQALSMFNPFVPGAMAPTAPRESFAIIMSTSTDAAIRMASPANRFRSAHASSASATATTRWALRALTRTRAATATSWRYSRKKAAASMIRRSFARSAS